jgi:hypothetical protein
MMTLSFDITARLVERGLVVFVASVDGKRVTSERYTPGDGERRRKVARRWCADGRLWHDACGLNDTIVPTVDDAAKLGGVLAALESAETDATVARDELDAQPLQSNDNPRLASYADDDIIVELGWSLESQCPDFIVYDRRTGKVSRVENIVTPVGDMVPPLANGGIITPGSPVPGSVFVPIEADPSGDDESRLRDDLAGFIERYVELSADALSIVIEYVILSWCFDAFDELPYLAFRTSDYGRGKSRALETVGAVCYRPIFVGGGSSAAATLRLLDTFGGTLVADEFDGSHDTELTATITKVLNQGFQRNRPILKCVGDNNEPRAFRCFGPKLFALRRGFGDDATESRTIGVRMTGRTRRDVPLNLPRAQFDADSLALRNRLLAWRFANLGRMTIDPSLADPELDDRLNQIGLPLLAVARDDETRTRIVESLRNQQGAIAANHADSLPGEILAAAMAIAEVGDVVRPGAVASELNRKRADASGVELSKLRHSVTANKVGWVMRSELELPRDRDKDGSTYRLAPARIAELAQRFGLPPTGLPPLQHCHPPTDCNTKTGDSDSAKADADNDGNDGNLSGQRGDSPVDGGFLNNTNHNPTD